MFSTPGFGGAKRETCMRPPQRINFYSEAAESGRR
jgi:hypothetical protein